MTRVSELETELRIAISGIQNGIGHINRLPHTEYDGTLEKARHHLSEAIDQIHLWAAATGVEILDRMPT